MKYLFVLLLLTSCHKGEEPAETLVCYIDGERTFESKPVGYWYSANGLWESRYPEGSYTPRQGEVCVVNS